MPRRLLLAADIVRDVAHSCDDPRDVDRLNAAAEQLDTLAKEVAQRNGIALELNGEFTDFGASIRRLAASMAPEAREPMYPPTKMETATSG